MILRDLVSRITFQTDTTQLSGLENTLGGIKKAIGAVAATALSGWAITAGSNIQLLEGQFKSLVESGSPLAKKVKELGEIEVGGKAVLSTRTLKEVGVALDQLGLDSETLADVMQFAFDTMVRSGGDFAGTALRMGQGLKEGGVLDELLKLNTISLQASAALGLLESKMSEDQTKAAVRAYREEILRIIRESTPELQEENFKFLTEPGTGAGYLSTVASFKNVWDQTAATITDLLEPAMIRVTAIMVGLHGWVVAFRTEIKAAGGVTEALFNKLNELFPEHTGKVEAARTAWKSLTEYIEKLFKSDLVAGATIGGLIMTLFTGKAVWVLGSVTGSVLLETITTQWKSVQDFLDQPLEGNILIGATLGGLLGFLLGGPIGMVFGGALGAIGAGKGTAALKEIQEDWNKLPTKQKQKRVEEYQSGQISAFWEVVERILGMPPGTLSKEPDAQPTRPRPGTPARPESDFPTIESQKEVAPTIESQKEVAPTIESETTSPLTPGGPPVSRKTTPKSEGESGLLQGAGASINWTGDMIISGVLNPTEVVREIERKFELVSRFAMQDLASRLENV